jgi:hypothetical protein
MYIFYSIDDNSSFPIIQTLVNNLNSVIGEGIESRNVIDLDSYCNYKHLNSIDISRLDYQIDTDDPFYDHYNSLFEINNIESKNDFLILLQYTDYLILLKLKELTTGNPQKFETDNLKTNNKKYKNVISRIESMIRFHDISFIAANLESQNKETEQDEKIESLINEIYDYIEQTFQKLNIDFKTINSLFKFCDDLQPHCDYISIFSTDVIVIFLFKKFFESGKFNRLLRNLVSIKKKVFILKLDDFSIDKSLFENINNDVFGGFYDLYKHKNDDFIGYEMHKFLADLVANDIWQINDVSV